MRANICEITKRQTYFVFFCCLFTIFLGRAAKLLNFIKEILIFTNRRGKSNWAMGGCRCTFRECENSTSSAPGMHFFHYPVKDWERCKMWTFYANKDEFLSLPADKIKNRVVCEMHFLDHCFMNIKHESLVKTAVPTITKLTSGEIISYEHYEKDPLELRTITKNLEITAASTSSKQLVLNCSISSKTLKDFDEPILASVSSSTTTTQDNRLTYDDQYMDYDVENLDFELDEERLSNHEIEILDYDERNDERPTTASGKTNKSPNEILKMTKSATKSDKQIIKNTIVKEKKPFKVFKIKDIDSKMFAKAKQIKQPQAEPTAADKKIDELQKLLEDKDRKIKELIISLKASKELIIEKTAAADSAKEEAAKAKADLAIAAIENLAAKKETAAQVETAKAEAAATVEACKAKATAAVNAAKAEAASALAAAKVEAASALAAAKAEAASALAAAKAESTAAVKTVQADKEVAKANVIQTEVAESSNQSPFAQPQQTNPVKTKIQLLNSVKKYLNSSMVALLRMEMFGDLDRPYKPDEKTFAIELFRLKTNVYDYLRSECRFRLPPPKEVELWIREMADNDEDDEMEY